MVHELQYSSQDWAYFRPNRCDEGSDIDLIHSLNLHAIRGKNMFGSRGKGSSSGFSLTELAITLGISAMLTAIAVPNFSNSWIPKHRLRIAVRKMATHAQEAKIAAAKTGRQSVVLFNATGYRIFIDQPPYDHAFDADGLDNELGTADDENLIRDVTLPKGIEYNTALGGGDGITFDSRRAPSLTFNTRGLSVRNANDRFVGGRVYLKNSRGKCEYLTVTNIGRILTREL